MTFKTTDLYDEFEDAKFIQVVEPLFRDYGGRKNFGGKIVTVKVFEDNTLVRATLEKSGEGQVLVVDGGGSLRYALVGDQVAALGYENGWAGLVVFGCIRDAADIAQIQIGVKALNTIPTRSIKRGEGQENISVKFAGVTFVPGDYLYADEDGIIVSPQDLLNK